MFKNVFAIRSLGSAFSRDQRGNVAVISALTVVSIMSLTGFAIDMRQTTNKKADVQQILDSGILASARALKSNADKEEATQALTEFMNANVDRSYKGTYCRPGEVEFSDDLDRVHATFNCWQKTVMLPVVGIPKLKFVVESESRFRVGTSGCVLALGPVPSNIGVIVSGSAAVNTDSCSVISNVGGPDSIIVGGSGTMSAACVHAAGGIGGDPTSITVHECSSPVPNDTPVRDPYSDLSVPSNVSSMPCTSPIKLTKFQYRLPAGRYCSDVRMKDVTYMDPGVHYFDGADLIMSSGFSNLQGKDVTLVFMNGGEISNSNGGIIQLEAPTTGPWAGIVMFGDPETAPTPSAMKFAGNSNTYLQGALYFPKTELEYRGGSKPGGGCTQIIAASVDFGGNSSLETDCEGVGVREFGPASEIYLSN